MTMTWYGHSTQAVTTPPAAGLDLTPLAGDYTCAAGVPGGISRLRSEPRDGTLCVRAVGHGEPGLGDLGEVAADAVFADAPHSRAGYAVLATFDDGRRRSWLQTYGGLGVVAVHGFHSFRDGRQPYFTREFFGASDIHMWSLPPDPAAVAARASARVGACDPAGLVGRWINVSSTATGMAEVEFLSRGPDVVARARTVGVPADLGEAPAHMYADAANPDGPPALLATYDLGFIRILLQARINRGLLVMGQYAQFADGDGRSDFMMRECFVRWSGRAS